MRRGVVAVLLAGYLWGVLDLTLWRFPQAVATPNLAPFATIGQYVRIGGWALVANVLGNVVVFAPLGALLPMLHRELRSVIAVTTFGLALSVLIEGLQFRSGVRVADVDDIILNTLGVALGYGVFVAVRGQRMLGHSTGP